MREMQITVCIVTGNNTKLQEHRGVAELKLRVTGADVNDAWLESQSRWLPKFTTPAKHPSWAGTAHDNNVAPRVSVTV
jgi:hypothetical protein